jgi:exodeoxyribonuclease VII large subunit
MQPSLFSAEQWSVSGLTKHIRDALEGDPLLGDLWVQGEISNAARPASGHLYFTLKDSGASLKCVMWRSSATRLEIAPQDGMAVAVHGKIGVYEVGGQYQLYADRLVPAGEGALYQEFLRLKASLEAEGLFSDVLKRAIPELPGRIGVVTAATAAAFMDVLDTLRRRLPMVEVVLAASAVQGERAPAQLTEALRQLNALRPRPDVILLVRGGGSMEDLWAFNDVSVVRAVATSETPVICGVGHETDFTLSDFAADLRAPTPTAAAELATQVGMSDLLQGTKNAATQLRVLTERQVHACQEQIVDASAQLRYFSPARRIREDRQRLDELARRSRSAPVNHLRLWSSALEGFRLRLVSLSPTEVLKRGFAIVTRRSDARLVRTVAQARGGIHVRVSDGGFDAEVS